MTTAVTLKVNRSSRHHYHGNNGKAGQGTTSATVDDTAPCWRAPLSSLPVAPRNHCRGAGPVLSGAVTLPAQAPRPTSPSPARHARPATPRPRCPAHAHLTAGAGPGGVSVAPGPRRPRRVAAPTPAGPVLREQGAKRARPLPSARCGIALGRVSTGRPSAARSGATPPASGTWTRPRRPVLAPRLHPRPLAVRTARPKGRGTYALYGPRLCAAYGLRRFFRRHNRVRLLGCA